MHAKRMGSVTVIAAAAMLPRLVHAADFTWDAGGADTNWSTVNNWLGVPDNTVPSAGDNVVFGTGGSAAVINTTSRTIGSLTFNRDADFALSASGGAGLTINTGISAAAPTSTGRTYAIGAPITLGANNVWDISSATGATTLTVSNVITDGVNTYGLTKTGNGVLRLSGVNNTFNGPITINGGTLAVTYIGSNTAVVSSIGQNNAIVLDGGVLRHEGGSTISSRPYTLGPNGGGFDASGAAGNNYLQITSAMTVSASSGAQTFTLSGSNAGTSDSLTNIISGVIQNGSGTNVTHLTKSGTGQWRLSGANAYTGSTTINGGTLVVQTLANGGVNSAIGKSTNAAANLVVDGSALKYIGATVSTDRLFSVGTSGATFDVSGSGSVNFTNAGAMGFNSQSGARTLTLSGTNTGANTLAAIIGDNGGATSLTKTGIGKWVLSGANTYTGSTTVDTGTLALGASDRIPDSSSLIVNIATATFDMGSFTDTVGGVRLAGGLIAGAAGSALTLNTGSFDIRSGTISTSLAGSAGLSKTTAGIATIMASGTYSGATTLGGGTLVVGTLANFNAASGIGSVAVNNASNLVFSGGILGWIGTSSQTTNRNFTLLAGATAGGFDSSASLATTTLTISGSMTQTGAGNRTLALTGTNAGNNTISTVIADAGVGSITSVLKSGAGKWLLGGANTYTGSTTVTGGTLGLGPSASLSDSSSLIVNGGTFDMAGTSDTFGGVSLISGSILGTAGTSLTLNSGNYDVQSGTIGVALAGSAGLTKTTAGVATITTSGTYGGATTISGGTLDVPSLGSYNAASGIGSVATNDASNLVLDGGVLQWRGAGNQTTDRNYTLTQNGGGFNSSAAGTSSLTISGSVTLPGAGNRTLTLGGTNTGLNTFSTAIVDPPSGGITSLTKTDAGTWVLQGANTYSGTTTLGPSSGILASGDSNVLSDSSVINNNGGTLDLGANHTDTIGGLIMGAGSVNGSGASALTFNNGNYDVRSGTVNVPLNGSAGLVKTSSASPTGTVTLNAANGYTGATTIHAGTVSLSSAAGALTGTAAIDIRNGGVLKLDNSSDATAADDRISGDVTLKGGTLDYAGRGNNADASRSDEVASRLLVAEGSSTLTIANSTRQGAGHTLASLTLNHASDGLPRSPGATLRFVDDADARVTADNHTEINGIVGGWMLYDDDDFAALSGANTGSIVIATGYQTATDSSTWSNDGTQNAKVASFTNFTASRNINSLILAGYGGGGAINAGAGLTINSGGVVLNDPQYGFQPKTISGAGTLTAGAGGGYEFIVHTTNYSHTISAQIADNGANAVSFTKSGTGNLNITGLSNIYSGTTYVAQGTLKLANAGTTNNIASSSKIIVHKGATLDTLSLSGGGITLASGQTLGGGGTVYGSVTASAANTTIAPGNSIGQLNFSWGNLTLSPSATLKMEIGGAGGGIGTAGIDFDQVLMSGSGKTLTIGGATLKLLPLPGIVTGQAYTVVTTSGGANVNFSTFFSGLANNLPHTDGNISYMVHADSTHVEVTFSAVPEPGTLAALVGGATAMLGRRRRE